MVPGFFNWQKVHLPLKTCAFADQRLIVPGTFPQNMCVGS
jgi:hypothetical protein